MSAIDTEHSEDALAGAPPAPEVPEYESPRDDEPPKVVEPTLEDDDDDEPPGPREEDTIEILVPKVDPIERRLYAVDRKLNREERTYVQKPLEYFQMLELYGIMGRAVQIVLEGEGGLDVDELMRMFDPRSVVDRMVASLPGGEDMPRMGEEKNDIDVNDATKILSAFSRVVAASPGILKDAYIVILGIPELHRKWAVDWAFPNITVDEGNDIMHTFIDQNWGLIEDFFGKEIPRLAKRAAKARQRHKSNGGRSRP